MNRHQTEAVTLVVCFGSLLCSGLAYQYGAIYSIGFVVAGVVAVIAIVMRANTGCDHK